MSEQSKRPDGFRVYHLGVSIKGKAILKDISLNFTMGRRTAIIGPNGAGKSTFLRAISGLNNDYEGTIELNGKGIRHMGRQKLARKLAILPQGLQAPPDTTVGTLVDYGRFPYRSWYGGSQDASVDREAVEWALSVTKLEPFKDRQVMTLSGGERQRAWIAMALAQKPEILLLDEPLLGLDPHAIKELKNYIEEMRQAGKTMLISTHIIDSVDMLWDRTIIMQNGHVKANVLKSEIDGDGKSLEDLFFEVTEGVDIKSVSEETVEEDDTKDTVQEVKKS